MIHVKDSYFFLISVSVCISISVSLQPFLPLSLPLPLFIEMALLQTLKRFVKTIPPRGTHSIGTNRGEHMAGSSTINWTSPAHSAPAQGGPRVITFFPPPPCLPMSWPLPNTILFSGRLPWPVGPSATTEVAPAGIQAWNYERMGLPPPPVVLWPQMWNCRFFSPPSSLRPVACRAEKIVFITCQDLPELSYVRQDSIKLSYTSMKLQNRSELNNKIISFRREAIPFFSSDTLTAKLWIEIECEGPGIETAITRSSM